MSPDIDVVIVGYGVGGQVLASLLGQRGHRVVVLERYPDPYLLPRMSTTEGDIKRLMQHASVGTDIGFNDQFVFSRGQSFGVDSAPIVDFPVGGIVAGHQSPVSVHQGDIEAAVLARVAQLPNVEVLWGYEASALEDLGDRVRITAAPSARATPETAGSGERVIEAKYAVGVDGASSFVRKSVGIELDVLQEHDDWWYLSDFDIVDSDLDTPQLVMYEVPEQPFYFGANGNRRLRTDAKVMGVEDPAEIADDRFAYEFLERYLGIRPEQVKLVSRKLYKFRSQVAKSFRKGRVFLGGDAAHAMTPFLSQGAATSMRDSSSLAWKLDLVLTGKAKAALLDEHETERMPIGRAAVEASLMRWRAIQEPDREKALARDQMVLRMSANPAAVAAMGLPGLTAGVIHLDAEGRPTPSAGHYAPQGRVRTRDGEEALLDDLVGYGFQLVSLLPLDEILSEEQIRLLDRIGAKRVALTAEGGEFEDVAGTYAEFFAQNEATTLIGRPDMYLFGLANGAEETSALVDDLLSKLRLEREPSLAAR